MTETNDDAGEALARFLYETIEHLDPTTYKKWGDLEERERGFYRDVTSVLLDRRDLLRAAIQEADR